MEEELEVNVVLPVSDEKGLKGATKKDGVLKSNVIEFGWPEHRKDVDQSVASYWDFKEYLTVCDDLLFKGYRLIVPESTKEDMLKTIHQGHFGSEECKKRAREVLF